MSVIRAGAKPRNAFGVMNFHELIDFGPTLANATGRAQRNANIDRSVLMNTRLTAIAFLALAACGGVQPQISSDGAVSAQVTTRPVLRGFNSPASPSRDGRLLASLDWEAGNPGNLAIVDLVTGA